MMNGWGLTSHPLFTMAKSESEILYFRNKSKSRFINHLLRLSIIVLILIFFVIIGIVVKQISILYVSLLVICVCAFLLQLGAVVYWYKDFSIISNLYEHATSLDIDIIEDKEK